MEKTKEIEPQRHREHREKVFINYSVNSVPSVVNAFAVAFDKNKIEPQRHRGHGEKTFIYYSVNSVSSVVNAFDFQP